MEAPAPAQLDLVSVILSSGPFGMLVVLLAVPALCVTLFGLRSETARTPMMGVAVNVGVLLLGLLGTLQGLLPSDPLWAPGPPTAEEVARWVFGMLFSLLPLTFAVLIAGPLLVLSLIAVALKLS